MKYFPSFGSASLIEGRVAVSKSVRLQIPVKMQIVTATLDVRDSMKMLEPFMQLIVHFTHDLKKKNN